MTTAEKKVIVDEILELLVQLTEENSTASTSESGKVEMLTIKECTEVIQGLSEHTVRQLVAQGKVKCIRTGAGKRGKSL